MSTHLPGFKSVFSFFLHHFVLAKLATSSIRVNIILSSLLSNVLLKNLAEED